MALVWREQFSVGNDLIDTDHQYLIEVINQAEVCLRAQNRPGLIQVLDRLGRYARAHFEREEKIARAIHYANADALHASHGELMERLQEFQLQVGPTWSDAVADQLTHFLREWLINHVIKEDLQMRFLLVKLSPRFDPR